MMIQLVYVSAACFFFTPEVIEDIVTVSRRNNARDQITGILIYKSGSVMQFLEGDAEKVRHRYSVIKKDPRHQQVTLIYDRPRKTRDFPDWSMAYREFTPSASKPPGYSDIFDVNYDWKKLGDRKAHEMLQRFVQAIQ